VAWRAAYRAVNDTKAEVLGRVEAEFARRRVNDPDTIRKPEGRES
jgi:hypothetical protein